jgi:hypothetical protein
MSKVLLKLEDLEYQPLLGDGADAAAATEDDWDDSFWSSFSHIGLSLVWLMASLQLLLSCCLVHPHLPAEFATGLCVAATIAAVCGTVASLGRLCWGFSIAGEFNSSVSSRCVAWLCMYYAPNRVEIAGVSTWHAPEAVLQPALPC